MNKKIKVIELINKIYANVDVPEKVKYVDKKYEYSKATQDYKSEDGEWLFQRMHTFFGRWLEREVEILEDEEEIDIKMFEQEWFEYYEGIISVVDVDLAVKMNEIVDKVNKLDKKINKEET